MDREVRGRGLNDNDAISLRGLGVEEIGALGARLARDGRVQVPDILTEPSAAQLTEEARDGLTYQTVTTNSRGHVDLPKAWLDSLSPDQKRGFGQAVQESAAERFQYLYDTYPLWDLGQEGRLAPYWKCVLDFLNGEAFLDLARTITGEARIAFADGQVTRYRRGCFLTGHTDEGRGKNRYYAYVLNLSPRWRLEWGGLLMFHGDEGHVSEAFLPKFNSLNLLKVPQPHSVSQVSLFAGDDRLAITGWLRGR